MEALAATDINILTKLSDLDSMVSELDAALTAVEETVSQLELSGTLKPSCNTIANEILVGLSIRTNIFAPLRLQ